MVNPAAACRREKDAHPERYCTKCLWQTSRSGPCPKHSEPESLVPALEASLELLRDTGVLSFTGGRTDAQVELDMMNFPECPACLHPILPGDLTEPYRDNQRVHFSCVYEAASLEDAR